MYPGDTFSTYNTVKPFSTENGYEMAGSYLNGKVVDSIGGGICQVSTTLYNAVLRAELEVTERHNHSMIVTYVDPSADAAIAESSGKDFVFVNNTDYPIYIDGHTADKKITFTIYGVETRAKNRAVDYESEVVEKKVPEADQIIAGRFPAYRRHQRQQRTYWLQGKTLEDCKGKRCGSQPGAGQQQQLQDEPQNGNRWNCFSGSECDQPDAGGHCDQQH